VRDLLPGGRDRLREPMREHRQRQHELRRLRCRLWCRQGLCQRNLRLDVSQRSDALRRELCERRQRQQQLRRVRPGLPPGHGVFGRAVCGDMWRRPDELQWRLRQPDHR
jgi:hypothetical protein